VVGSHVRFIEFRYLVDEADFTESSEEVIGRDS
jgi:hypothetical protein